MPINFKFAYEQHLDLRLPLEFTGNAVDLESALEEVSRQSNLSFKQINQTIPLAIQRTRQNPGY